MCWRLLRTFEEEFGRLYREIWPNCQLSGAGSSFAARSFEASWRPMQTTEIKDEKRKMYPVQSTLAVIV